MNLIDASLTILWVTAAYATEANPFMAVLLNAHPFIFMVFKITLVSLGVHTLWEYRERWSAYVGGFIVFFAYAYVMYIHFSFLYLTFVA